MLCKAFAHKPSNNFWRMQCILGWGNDKKPIGNKKKKEERPRQQWTFQQKDPNAMDINTMSTEQQDKAMRKGLCFGCGKQGHLSRDCPTQKKPITVSLTPPSYASNGLVSTPELAKLLGSFWLSDKHINMMIEELLLNLKNTPKDNVQLVNLLFVMEIWKASQRKSPWEVILPIAHLTNSLDCWNDWFQVANIFLQLAHFGYNTIQNTWKMNNFSTIN